MLRWAHFRNATARLLEDAERSVPRTIRDAPGRRWREDGFVYSVDWDGQTLSRT